MKQLGRQLKPFLRWIILGGTLFFLLSVLKRNWQEVLAIRLEGADWALLAIALGVTLVAHVWAGWVWSWMLRDFQQPIDPIWTIQAYLKTNIAKYLPGNVWHYYGRITAATRAGASLEVATVSVLLEPILMAAAALLVTLLSSQQIAAQFGWPYLILQWVALVAVLTAIQPRILNPLLHRLRQVKQTIQGAAIEPEQEFQLKTYPWQPLLGEMGFLILRGVGFLLTFLAISPLTPGQLPLLFSSFSLAWLLGMVVPGAPGGLGVFEVVAIALLGTGFSTGTVLGVAALYRLVSILSEAIGAGTAWLDERQI
jgi:uncharacterized membrane protein YbhN (UPF0104 family)